MKMVKTSTKIWFALRALSVAVVISAACLGLSFACLAGHAYAETSLPDPKTVLPAPEVEMDVVRLLADFPRKERPYVQEVVHTAKDLSLLNKECSKKAAVYWQEGLPEVSAAEQLDLADVTAFNQGYLKYFDPLRFFLKQSYRRLYAMAPPKRFGKAHRFWLAYMAYALENLEHQREARDVDAAKPQHSPVEVAQYRAWAYRLFKENGLDLTPYMLKSDIDSTARK